MGDHNRRHDVYVFVVSSSIDFTDVLERPEARTALRKLADDAGAPARRRAVVAALTHSTGLAWTGVPTFVAAPARSSTALLFGLLLLPTQGVQVEDGNVQDNTFRYVATPFVLASTLLKLEDGLANELVRLRALLVQAMARRMRTDVSSPRAGPLALESWQPGHPVPVVHRWSAGGTRKRAAQPS